MSDLVISPAHEARPTTSFPILEGAEDFGFPYLIKFAIRSVPGKNPGYCGEIGYFGGWNEGHVASEKSGGQRYKTEVEAAADLLDQMGLVLGGGPQVRGVFTYEPVLETWAPVPAPAPSPSPSPVP